MKVTVQGQGPVTLLQSDFVAAGGEGSVYCKGTTAYKIYADPKRMLPLGKMSELAAITDKDVIKPEVVLLDTKSATPVGYTMRFVADTMPLCQIFTRAFREREGLDHPKMLRLVQALQARVQSVHAAGIVVVDGNEMNYLVDRRFQSVLAIDVDSYQTKSYPASALMPSVRDWQVVGSHFTPLSDWFSFACVAFQMFVGIHPYKGQHATLKGFEARMQASASVLGPGVKVPAVVYPFSVIPSGYLAWFQAVLQDGKRMPPPSDPLAATSPVTLGQIPTRMSGSPTSARLEIVELFTMSGAIVGYYAGAAQSSPLGVGVHAAAWTDRELILDGRTIPAPSVRAVVMSVRSGEVVSVALETIGSSRYVVRSEQHGRHELFAASASTITGIMAYHGRLYAKAGTTIVELTLHEAMGKVSVRPNIVANILEHATHMYDGVALTSMLGATYASIFPEAGSHHQVRVRELDGLKVVDAKYDGANHRGVLQVVAGKGGSYARLTFVVDEASESAQMFASVDDITPAGLNFVCLESGVCVEITEEDMLEIWSFHHPSKSRQQVAPVGNDMRLVHHRGGVGGIRGQAVYSLRMK
jgi:hypothetical protein